MAKRRFFHPDEPLKHPDHHRPRTRREFIAQGFALGAGTVVGSSLLGLLASPARAALSSDLATALTACAGSSSGGGMIPFICFDLAGGANFAGSNVLVGRQGGQLDFISVEGYSRLGLPSGMVPSASAGNFIDETLGLAFHSDSAILRGIVDSAGANYAAMAANTNGAVLPARSENDTGNNPHNPMYALYRAGARGSLVNLIGSQSSDSGGNSMAPAMLIDLSARPTKVDRPTDVTGLVGTSDLPRLLSQSDSVAALEALKRISDRQLDTLRSYRAVPESVGSAKCEILKSVANAERFGSTPLDPLLDPDLFGVNGVFGTETNNGEYRKAASVMKLVLDTDSSGNHFGAAGTITMGGYDYHTGDRATGELRDYRAGRCIGACLEYARRKGTPVMVYVFSDGSVSSNGMIDNSPEARGKPQWTSDNQATACSFFLVYNPTGRAQLLGGTELQMRQHQQIGWFNSDGSVNTQSSPAGNSVIQLVDMVVLNYLALSGRQNLLSAALAGRPESSILGGPSNWDRYTAFAPLT
jgi:hypothetical protein